LKKSKAYYQNYLADIRTDLGILLRKKLFKYHNEIFQSLDVLISEPESIAKDITSKISPINDIERAFIEQSILTLLDEIKRSRIALRALYELQMNIKPDNQFIILEGV
jgi:hypothetical protein